METAAMDASVADSVKVPDSVLRRDQRRLEELERRKHAKESKAVSEEKPDHFSAAFNAERSAIEQLLSGCGQAERRDALQMFEDATVKCQQLQKLVNDSMMFLSQYELRQAQENLQKLQSSLAERRSEVMPKKKFAFTSRTTGSTQKTASTPPDRGGTTRTDRPPAGHSARDEYHCGFSNITNEVLVQASEDLQHRDVLLSHLTHCQVRLLGSPNTLHIKNVTDCQILCGPVSSSVFVDACKDSTLVLACQQLRTHNTTDTQVYLHVTSRAIIEDCTGVRFAPFNWVYDELDADFKVSGLDPSRNNWTQVDDFNWLAAGTPSPNWSIIPESERKTRWDP